MLTRAGVAKRLGISIASVRRMEGNELHPWTDERGVHEFDAGEVEALAEARRGESHAATTTLRATELSQSRERGGRLQRELEAAQDALRTAMARTATLEREAADMRTTAIEALELVEVALGSGVPYGVRQVLRRLQRDA